MPIVRVALDVPVPKVFDYVAATATADDVGRLVEVPFGPRRRVGLVLEVVDASGIDADRLKPAGTILREGLQLPADVLALIRFCADYYHHPIGPVVAATLPGGLSRPPQQRSISWYALTEAGRAVDTALQPKAAVVKRRLLALLAATDQVDPEAIAAVAPTAGRVLRQLVAAGWVVARTAPSRAAPHDPTSVDAPRLSDGQAAAVAAIRAAGGDFASFLLQGVTGSGKTEVYLRLIGETLREGRQSLLLVPEINLTPQAEAMFRARFPGVRLVSLHSGLAPAERRRNWSAAASGDALVVLGTRLSVFTPLPKLGLVIVDEEHDASFKQAEGLRYSARDLAVWRAHHRGVPVVLGSATPSLESYQHARSGRYRRLLMPERASGALPAVRLVDVREKKLDEGLSEPLLAAIGERLAAREQSLVFINRRGFAPVLLCHACGWSLGCHRCSARLVFHARGTRMLCHHCGHEESPPVACPTCGNADLRTFGQGTQRIEAALLRRFPLARVARVDSDSTRNRDAWAEMRRRIDAHEIDILVGTQMLAKGHDFPKLNLVGAVNADGALYSSDFRATERLFAQLMQVAGRAGRVGEGTVLIQTEFPTHPLYAAVVRHDYDAFAQSALAERRLAGFPPFVHQAVLRAEAKQIAAATAFLLAARDCVPADDAIMLYDPVPATMVRKAGVERAQLLVQGDARAVLQRFLAAWVERLPALAGGKVRWLLDVDPLDV